MTAGNDHDPERQAEAVRQVERAARDADITEEITHTERIIDDLTDGADRD
jgi:hypothetical protein